MIYLLLGEDRAAKEERIAEIKTKYLTPKTALPIDYELLHATKLDPADLKKALIALPAIAKKRLVLIRNVEKLGTHHKKIFLEFIEAQHGHAVLVLDADGSIPKNAFFNKVMSVAKTVHCGQETSKQNVFDMTRAMEGRNSSGALKILGHLLNDGNHPLQIMGGLVWFWGKLKSRLPAQRFKKGLLVLQEADFNIKRSRLKPEYALELAVTKLSSLIAC